VLPKIYKLLDDHHWPFIAASQNWHRVSHASFASAHAGTEDGDAVNITFVDSTMR
ncbi:hypothetical protein EJ07DRAFT_117053, partial [Lizonia empirigonia]